MKNVNAVTARHEKGVSGSTMFKGGFVATAIFASTNVSAIAVQIGDSITAAASQNGLAIGGVITIALIGFGVGALVSWVRR